MAVRRYRAGPYYAYIIANMDAKRCAAAGGAPGATGRSPARGGVTSL